MEEKQFAPVAVAACSDYSEDACRRAITELSEKLPVLKNIKSGTKVVIKVNLITLLRPERAATTHPALLTALVELLCAKGAEVIIGDSPGGPYQKTYLDSVYRMTGMTEAVKVGASLNDNFAVKRAKYPSAVTAKEFDYTAYLDDADLIINFCKLKTHAMMTMSCAVKNMFGVIPGLTKPAYHYLYPDYPSFANMLIDLNEYFHPALNIADAVIGMEGNGPTSGTPRHIGAVLASESPYALDLVCADLIGLEMPDVPTLQIAHSRGLAPARVDSIPLLGKIEPYRISDFATASRERELVRFSGMENGIGTLINTAARNLMSVRPTLTREKCLGCGKCAELCPAHAIEIRNKLPEINRKTCIRCFCCQEFCPAGALFPRRSYLGNLLIKKAQK